MPLSFTKLSQLKEKTKGQAELFRGKAQEMSQRFDDAVNADRKGFLYLVRSIAVMAGICAVIYFTLAILQIMNM